MNCRKPPSKTFPPFDPNEIQPDLILIHPDGVRCRVDQVKNGKVYVTAMHGWKINGGQEIVASVDDVANRWTLLNMRRKTA